MPAVFTHNGEWVDFFPACKLMDEDLLEETGGWCAKSTTFAVHHKPWQYFFDHYCGLHAEKFGSAFVVSS